MKPLLLLGTLLVALHCKGQVSVGYYQSNLPFFGVNIGIKNKLKSELRLGTDQYLDKVSVEGILTYHFVQ